MSGIRSLVGQPPSAWLRRLSRAARPSSDALLCGVLIYGLLACYALLVFFLVLAVGGVDEHSGPVPMWLQAMTLPIVTLTIRPVRRWIDRGVNQVVYGHHDNPYAFVTRMHDRLEADATPSAMVPSIAASLAGSLKLPYVSVETVLGGAPHAATFGVPPDGCETYAIPLAYRAASLGTLRVSARRSGEPLSPDDTKLLHDLARQAGITLHAAQLTEALQASRLQIVSAREEERRRIRRDLHDGLGPTLASLRMQLTALRRTLPDPSPATEALIDGLRDDVLAATADIRRLVYDLRPPMLDELGLVGALRGLGAAGAGAVRTFDVPDALPPLPAAIEVAAYRIAAEALHNVDRHAGASSCNVHLSLSPAALTLAIADDGVGLPEGCTAGVGFVSMRERAEELGGTVTRTSSPGKGTTVAAVLPLAGAA